MSCDSQAVAADWIGMIAGLALITQIHCRNSYKNPFLNQTISELALQFVELKLLVVNKSLPMELIS
ncbi:hypothetical protein EHS15_09625 [Leptospira idonii]|uniref:Uncharacterized protein n=1 Tax=Leptospira idonii TaxID=1193500 RepID=A0A4R9LZI0_9LEPT|nr:hypothetical protein EHS15_09625 [Leptospira idonii]